MVNASGGVAAGAGLRGGVGQQRAEQGDAARPGGEQQVRGGVAGVDGVLAGAAGPGGGQRVVDRLGHRHVGHGRLGGGHVGDQVREPGRPVSGSSSAGSLTVSVRWTLYPSQPLPRFSEYRASVS